MIFILLDSNKTHNIVSIQHFYGRYYESKNYINIYFRESFKTLGN